MWLLIEGGKELPGRSSAEDRPVVRRVQGVRFARARSCNRATETVALALAVELQKRASAWIHDTFHCRVRSANQRKILSFMLFQKKSKEFPLLKFCFQKFYWNFLDWLKITLKWNRKSVFAKLINFYFVNFRSYTLSTHPLTDTIFFAQRP